MEGVRGSEPVRTRFALVRTEPGANRLAPPNRTTRTGSEGSATVRFGFGQMPELPIQVRFGAGKKGCPNRTEPNFGTLFMCENGLWDWSANVM